MASKKIRLSFDPSDDYRLIGITTSLPDYLLVYRLNQKLRWGLHRLGSFRVYTPAEQLWYFVFHYRPDDYTEYFLTGNARPTQWMAEPSLLITKGANRPETFLQTLTDCSLIEDVMMADDLSTLITPETQVNGQRRRKTADRITNVLYDLEIFMIELSRQSRFNLPPFVKQPSGPPPDIHKTIHKL